MKVRRILAVAAVLAALGAAAFGTGPARAVIGGHDATPDEAPYMAYLVTEDDSFFCGGTVVAERWVVTAAHCVLSDEKMRVVVGRTNQSDTNAGREVEVVQAIPHPHYNAGNAVGDIALLVLAEPVGIAPIRLAGAAEDGFEAAGAEASVFGWGSHLVPSPVGVAGLTTPDHLQTATVNIVDDESCAAAYATAPTELVPVVGSPAPSAIAHVCASALLTDTCYGDSGGPLVAQTPSGPVQIGVVSTGFACAVPTHPGIYTEINTPPIRDWITTTAGI